MRECPGPPGRPSLVPRRSVSLVLVALFACRADPPAAPAAPAAPALAPASGTRTPLRPREDVPGVPNFAQVSAALYRGAQPTAEGMRALQAMGVKTIVNLRLLHSDRDRLEGTGLQYLHIHAAAWHPEDEDVARVLRVIRDPANQPVFVHCQHGADRTGTMVAAYRIVEQGWTSEEAAAELPNFGYHPIWTEILDYLAHFDRAAMQAAVTALPPPTLEVVR